MARKQNVTDQFMAEVVSYGGLPVTRATAHALAMETTGDRQAADWFAFGRQVRRLPDALPLTAAEANVAFSAA